MAQRYASAWYVFIQQQQSLVFTVSSALLRPNMSEYTVTGITLVVVLTAAGEGVVSSSKMPTLTLTYGEGKDTQSFSLVQGTTQGTLTASATLSPSTDISRATSWKMDIATDPNNLMIAVNVSNMIIGLTYTADFN